MAAAPCAAVTVEAAQAKARNGWVRKSGKWYYYRSGKKKKGWVKVSKKWYYLHKSTGVMQTGWKRIDGKWYFLDPKSGAMKTGWLMVDGSWYFLNTKSGVMQTGWLQRGSKWYYMDKTSGVMSTGWMQDAGKTYYMDADGVMLTKLQTIDGKQYYFRSSGYMYTGGWKMVSGKLRFFGQDGVMAVNTTVTVDGAACVFDVNGDLTNQDELPDALKAHLDELTGAAKATTAANTAAASTTAATTTSGNTSKGKYTAAFVTKNCGITGKRAQFVADIANAVTKYAPSYGIKVYSPVIAQAIHESAWGESTLGAKYHNYFGLKCGTTWTGKSVNVKTTEEYTVGKISVIRDNFRVYDNLDIGVKGYFEFIQKDRYKNLKGVTSPRKYLENIKADGYATGSQYVTNTMRVITTYNLTVFDPK